MAEKKKELYRVRKSWNDSKSQLGAYSILANAIKTCDKAGEGYYVFNAAGEVIHPDLKKDEVKLDISKVDTSAADPKVMWDFFKSKGLNDYGVAGLMGNLYAESGLRASNLQNTYEKSLGMTDAEYTATVDAGVYTNFINDKAGYGLAQWTYWSLKEQMYKYFQEKGKSIGDLNTQMEFLAYQLSNHYKHVWEVLENATSVREASDVMLLKFERPADQSEAVQEKRAAYGQKYYDSYHSEEVIEEKPQVDKYSDENPPMVCMQTQSTCYKGTTTMKVKGVLWHSTGANNPTLKRYVQPSDNATDKAEMLELLGVNKYKNDWNHIERQAGLNAWIGKLADGTVTTVQTMPWNYKPWGCGSGSKGSCNSGWIQFEICEDDLKNEDYFNAIYKEACKLTAYLCEMFDIDPLGTVTHNGVTVPTILCHADSYKLKLGSNHGDVLHWFKKYGKTMDDVRADVASLMPPREAVKEEINIIEPIEQFKVNDIVRLKDGAVYYNGKTISSWVLAQEWIVSSVKGDRVVINKSTSTSSAINSPIHQDNLILVKREEVIEQKSYYKVRKSYNDAKSQIGAYINLENAIESCIKAGAGYSVYDSQGKAVYTVEAQPEEPDDGTLKVGSEVKLIPGAKYASGANIPQWLFGYKLYIREIRSNGNFVISTQKTGAVTGVVSPDAVIAHSTPIIGSTFNSYIVRITADALNVRNGPGVQYKINTVVKKNELYTIIGESNGWGRLKSGAGWICLDGYTKKM